MIDPIQLLTSSTQPGTFVRPALDRWHISQPFGYLLQTFRLFDNQKMAFEVNYALTFHLSQAGTDALTSSAYHVRDVLLG